MANSFQDEDATLEQASGTGGANPGGEAAGAREPSGPGKGEDDGTLGGYLTVHSRPPAFEGCDGQPYTVSAETEGSPNLKSPVRGYLVFPRWAANGLGIVGHLESPLLWEGPTRGAVMEKAGAMSLHEVQRRLNEAIVRKAEVEDGSEASGGPPEEFAAGTRGGLRESRSGSEGLP